MPVKRRHERGGKAGRRPRKRREGWALAIHGGAGASRENRLARREQAIRDALAAVLEAGAKALAAGAASLDVVEAAVCALEDSPLFNAGKGSVFNSHGEHELEASIMDGSTLEAGAVANVRGIKNPVALARLVMDRSPHVFLHGEGAVAFAQANGMHLVAPDYFWTEERWNSLKDARLHVHSARSAPHELSTVGAVALDRRGNLAAATSTGGLTNKLRGRVGDSSVIGAGIYASNESCAVSCTGEGEYFIRATIARDVCALVEYGDIDAKTAAKTAIGKRLGAIGGRGGVIVVDRGGGVTCVFNTNVMYRGAVTHDTPIRTALYDGEKL